MAFHLAPLVKNLTDNVSILTSGEVKFNPEQLSKLKNKNIKIIEKKNFKIEHEKGYIRNIIFDDKSKESFEASYAALTFKQNSEMPESLGCELNEQGYIKVDMMQKTTVEGAFACGDNCSRMRSVANAVASGSIVGAMINMELSSKQF